MKSLLQVLLLGLASQFNAVSAEVRVWEKVELTFHARNQYPNPYTNVLVWVDLKGPDFDKRCYGFWDGDDVFRVRVLATRPGRWSWRSSSNQNDDGLNDKSGQFTAVASSDEETSANPLLRGLIKPSVNGHS